MALYGFRTVRLLEIERLDYHDLAADIIDELELMEIIGRRLQDGEQDTASTRKVIKPIIDGFGLCNRSSMLSPQFHQNLPMGSLLRPGNQHLGGRV